MNDMNTTYRNISPSMPGTLTNQNGSALPISLFILLVLTIIGATSLNGTVMEEKMSANFQNGNVAFQAAESSVNRTFKTISNSFTLADQVLDARDTAAATGNDAVWPSDAPVTIEGVAGAGTNDSAHSRTDLAATIQFSSANEAPGGGCTIVIGSPTKCSSVVLDIVATGRVTGTTVSRVLTQGMEKPFPPGS
jgi:hypothetical protein